MLPEPWYFGFCSCFRAGCCNCMGMTCCACCQYGRALNIAFGDNCCICCFLFPVFCVGACMSCCKRQQIRDKYSLEVILRSMEWKSLQVVINPFWMEKFASSYQHLKREHMVNSASRLHKIHTRICLRCITIGYKQACPHVNSQLQGSSLEDFFVTCLCCWSICQMIQEIEARENKKIKCCGSVGDGPKGPPIVVVKVSPEMTR